MPNSDGVAARQPPQALQLDAQMHEIARVFRVTAARSGPHMG